MDALAFLALVVVGFVACAEFGSYAFVHPVLRRLPERVRIDVEQGLLRTFGRFMPVGMPLTVVLACFFAVAQARAHPIMTAPVVLGWAAVAALVAAVVSTVIVNVPINLATGHWDIDKPPEDWSAIRDRWDRFQGVRSWLLLIGFVLECATAVTS